jgi:tetratricopeptide (TPR) repeat protein
VGFVILRELLKEFEAKRDYSALSSAIGHFREATQEDPNFALAYYLLGLSLHQVGEPTTAVTALQTSLRADPYLLPAYVALASSYWAEASIISETPDIGPSYAGLISAFYNFERPHFLETTDNLAKPHFFESTNPGLELEKLALDGQHIEKARGLWLDVLRLSRRVNSATIHGSAYYGLCNHAYRQGSQQPRLHRQWHYMAYYYCKRAEALYAGLATVQHTKPEVKKQEAAVFHTFGVILANFQQSTKPSVGDPPGWDCWATKPGGILKSREALKYFNRALYLLPDNYLTRCYAARTAYALGDLGPLEQLKTDFTAHLNLANSHRRLAGVCAWVERPIPGRIRLENTSYRGYVELCDAKDGTPKSTEHFQRALDEYDEVVGRVPMNIEALTGYANTVWEWLISARPYYGFRGQIEYYAVRAVGHARKAVGLSSSSPDDRLQALVRSSLGKAFLAQGRLELAIMELEEVTKVIPNHPAYHEIHWALAQAYLCSASTAKRARLREEDVQPMEKLAVALLRDIRQHEDTREFRPYSTRPGVLGSPWGTFICNPSDPMESLPDPPLASKTVGF